MYILYKNIGFTISLAKKTRFSIPVPFLFRSIIGYQLRKMCCIAHNVLCADCMFNATCIYGLTFESIVPKNNPALTGRDRISHPVIIDCDDFTGIELDSLVLNLVFLGSTIPYFPYFYHALKKGGESGITKERVPYQVSDITELSNTGKTHSLMKDDYQIDTQLKPEQWEYNPETEMPAEQEKNFEITLVTPLRYKSRGGYAGRLADAEFAGCLHRRAQVLCSQYGRNDHSGEYRFSGNWTITEQNVKWRDFAHYSARQKKAMQLGGLVGDFTLSGKFTSYECSLLRFAELFHGGKNTNFGLGKIKVNEHGIL